MQPDIHPEYRQVIFEDSVGGQRWRCGSTVDTQKTTVWEEDGQEYRTCCSTSPPTRTHSSRAR